MSNNHNHTSSYLHNLYDRLPASIQDMIFSDSYSEVLDRVQKDYQLSDEQVVELAKETSYILLGASPPKDFVRNLSSAIEMDVNRSAFIAQEMNRYVFFPVKDELKQVHEDIAAIHARRDDAKALKKPKLDTPKDQPTKSIKEPPVVTPPQPVKPEAPTKDTTPSLGQDKKQKFSLFEQKLGGMFRVKKESVTSEQSKDTKSIS